MVMRAQQSGQDPQEFANHMFEHNHVPELVAEIRRGKALAQIVENATVTDASGNVVDLTNLRPDGTLGDPAETATDEAAETDARPPTTAEGDPPRPDASMRPGTSVTKAVLVGVYDRVTDYPLATAGR